MASTGSSHSPIVKLGVTILFLRKLIKFAAQSPYPMKSILVILLLLLGSICSGFSQTPFRLSIEVRDKQTKHILIPIISILPANASTELTGYFENDLFMVKVQAGIQYQVVVAFQEYKTYRQTHVFEPSKTNTPFLIELEPLKTASSTPSPNLGAGHTLLVIHKAQKSILANASISLKDPRNGKIVVIESHPNIRGGWKADLQSNVSYEIEVKAPDFETYRGILKINSGQATEIALSTIPKQELSFQAVDALTGQAIPADFKLTDEIKESYSGSTTSEQRLFMPTVVVQSQPYHLTVIANGYRKYVTKLNVDAPQSSEQSSHVIRLSKSDVYLQVSTLAENTNKPIAATIRVVDKNDKRDIVSLKNTPDGRASVPLNPAHYYVVEVTADGFMPYQRALEKSFPSLEENNELVVKLAPITENFLSLSAIDSTSGKPISAKFRITANSTHQTSEITALASAMPIKFKITEPDIYQIETIAAGYSSQKGIIDAEEMRMGQVFRYQVKLKAGSSPTNAVKLFTFNYFDSQTRRPLPKLKLTVKEAETHRLIPSTFAKGILKTKLALNKIYVVEAQSSTYEQNTLRIETSAWAQRGEFLTNIYLMKVSNQATSIHKFPINEKIFDNIKAGQSVTIEDNVYFDQSSYILRPESHGQLTRLANIMLQNPAIQIEIVGHTDNVGDSRLNQALSEQRAKVIASFLTNLQVPENRIKHRGEGASKPLAPNDSEENRQRNRRVQFLVK